MCIVASEGLPSGVILFLSLSLGFVDPRTCDENHGVHRKRRMDEIVATEVQNVVCIHRQLICYRGVNHH